MRSTFLGFETARKGLQAAQKGIDIVGQNIVNINSEGYTRQRVDFVSMNTSTRTRFATGRISNTGQGVKMNGVSQIRDPYLDTRFRQEISNTAYYDKAMSIMDGIEGALDEVEGAGLTKQFSDFVDALQNFSNYPNQVANANLVMTSTKNITALLRQYNTQLTGLQDQQKFDLNVNVTSFNTNLQKLAALNKAISEEQVYFEGTTNSAYGPNELLDQRNIILDELSTFADIRIKNEIDGTVSLSINEQTILSGSEYDQVILKESDEDHTVSLNWLKTGKTVTMNGGMLKASADLINGTSLANRGPQYYKDCLDDFANRFASILNNAFVHTVRTDDGMGNITISAGGKMQLINDTPNTAITAENIKVNDKWLANAGMIMDDFQKTGEKDATFILKLIERLEGKQQMGNFSGSLMEFVDQYNTTIGSDKSYYETRYDASLSVADDLNDRRDSVMAVLMDEEGASMMQYEKWYQAISRVMTTMDEALDVLINRTGLVGR